MQPFTCTLFAFDKESTRTYLLYEDYSQGQKSLSTNELLNYAQNLKPMTQEDFQKYGAIHDYLKELEQKRR